MLADLGQLLAAEEVDDAVDADGATGQNEPVGVIGGHLTDAAGPLAALRAASR